MKQTNNKEKTKSRVKPQEQPLQAFSSPICRKPRMLKVSFAEQTCACKVPKINR